MEKENYKNMTIEDHINAALRMCEKSKDEIIDSEIHEISEDIYFIYLKAKDWRIKIAPLHENFRCELIKYPFSSEFPNEKDLLKLIVYRFNENGALNFSEIVL